MYAFLAVLRERHHNASGPVFLENARTLKGPGVGSVLSCESYTCSIMFSIWLTG